MNCWAERRRGSLVDRGCGGGGSVLAARQGSLGSSRSTPVSGAMLLSHQSAIVAGLLSLLFYYLTLIHSYRMWKERLQVAIPGARELTYCIIIDPSLESHARLPIQGGSSTAVINAPSDQ